MNAWKEKARRLLDMPSKVFSMSGIAQDGSLVDVMFSFNQIKHLTNSLPRDPWVVVPVNFSNVKFDRQTLISMKQKDEFVDCLWIENKIQDPWMERQSNNQLRTELLDKIEKRLVS